MPFANNNGVKIYYEVEGQGPPLILHHGFSGTLKHWIEFGYAQELSKDYRLIMLDARGHGSSDKPHDEKAYDFKFTVGDLVAILDDLKIEKANYLGYSMGGRIGFRISMYAPERFISLIIGGAAYPILGDEDAEDDILIGHREDLEKAFREAPNSPIQVYVAERERRAGPRPPAIRATMLANDPRALLASISAALGAKSPKWDKVLPYMNLPCLLWVGESDPRFPKVKESANLMPNATFFSLPGLDHWQGSARSDLTLPHIKKFLAEVNA